MNSKTAYNHYSRLKTRLADIFGAAECYCPKHEEILSQIKTKIHEDTAFNKCPDWVRRSLFDYASGRFERIGRDLTIWLFTLPDGVAKCWDILTEEERATFTQAEPRKTGNFYWLRQTTGTGTVGDINAKENKQTGKTLMRSFEVTMRIYS